MIYLMTAAWIDRILPDIDIEGSSLGRTPFNPHVRQEERS